MCHLEAECARIAARGHESKQPEVWRVPRHIERLQANDAVTGAEANHVDGSSPADGLESQRDGWVAEHLCIANGRQDIVLARSPESRCRGKRTNRRKLQRGELRCRLKRY